MSSWSLSDSNIIGSAGYVNNNWTSIAYGNSIYVVVASSGTGNRVMTSVDGLNWTMRESVSDITWNSVTFGNGKFVAVASTNSNNCVMTSSDGITWTITTAIANVWTSVTYGNGVFVAVAKSGTNSRVMTSTDGITWTSGDIVDNSWNCVTYGNGKFVAVAESGTGNRAMYSTDNGMNWIIGNSVPDNKWSSVTYGANKFVAVSQSGYTNMVMTSTDDINWTPQSVTSTDNWLSVTYGNGYFVAVGVSSLNRIMTSTDGVSWSNRTMATNNNWISVIYGADKFIAVSSNGDGNRVITSSDAINWTVQYSAASNKWRSITYGNGIFVAVSYSGTGKRVMTSPDGIIWTSRTSAANNNWYCVTYGNNLFVAVATTGNGNRVMTSPDGITWTSRTSAANNFWYSVTYGLVNGNGLFVAVASSGTGNGVMTSPNGINWTLISSVPNYDWQSVTYGLVNGNGLFVAVAEFGDYKVMTSSDGTNWSVDIVGIVPDVSWWNVTYGNGIFVAVSSSDKIIKSNDGINWTSVTIPNNYWFSITYGSGLFIAVAVTGSNSRIITSKDGTSWNNMSYPLNNNWKSIAYGNDKFVTICDEGVVTSPTLSRTIPIYYQINNELSVPTITNFYISPKIYGESPFTITQPTSNSDGTFSYTSSDTSVATISNNIITIHKAGSSTITATQEATTNYLSGSITTNFQVNQAVSTIINFSISPKIYGDNPFTITQPTSNSDGTFSYTSSDTSVATISDNIITILKAGSSTITATQAATTNYLSGFITANFQINQAVSTISNFSIPTKKFGDPSFTITQPTSNSDGTFSYTSSDTLVATISNSTITIHKAGSSTITATQAATTNYLSGTKTATLIVDRSNQTITFDDSSYIFNDPTYTLNATSSSSLTITYVSSDPNIASINGNQLTFTGYGEVIVTAYQNGNSNYNPAPNVVKSFSTNAKAGTIWHLSTTTWTNNNNDWQSVTYGNGLFVAVAIYLGTADGVMTSFNGITWTSRTSAADNDWRSVTYGNNLFVAVADSRTGNRVMTSPDGINWTIRTSAPDNKWRSVTYGNGIFVAVAESGTGNRVMTSPDGITWTSRTSAADNQWTSVTYGNGLFVAVAESGTDNRVMTSENGIDWISRTSAANNNWTSVTYCNDFFPLFVAVASSGQGNRVMTSPDGINWTSRTSAADNFWTSVTYGNGLFVAVASSGTGNRVMTSPDGITWTSRTSAADNQWTSVTYGNGLFVAVTFISLSNEPSIPMYSIDQTPSTISGFSIPTKKFGDPSFTITQPTSNSTGAFNYISSDTSVAKITGNTITILKAGSSIIIATQAATTNYLSGTKTATLIVDKSNQTITFDDSSYTFNDPTYTLNATSSSGLTITYVSSDPNIASINGNQLTFSTNGEVIVTASQNGNSNYNLAIPLTKTFIRNVMDNTNYTGAIQAIANSNSIITNANGNINITVPNSNFTQTTGVAYMIDTPYPGSVVIVNIEASNDSGTSITDFSTDPLVLNLYLPQANPRATLLMYKLNTGTNIKMNPQPNGYPITLQYQSGSLWTATLPSLSSYLIQDINPSIDNNVVCFNQGSKILCLKNSSEIYEPIENLRNGDLIKTINNGFKPIVMIGKSIMFNKAYDDRIRDQLYICKKEDYPELIEDLIITGCHSILVDNLTDKQKGETIRQLKDIYVTDRKYRLMACINERTKVYQKRGYHIIYHLALENDYYYGNYGIYANGLLVESCSKRYLKELSNMTLI